MAEPSIAARDLGEPRTRAASRRVTGNGRVPRIDVVARPINTPGDPNRTLIGRKSKPIRARTTTTAVAVDTATAAVAAVAVTMAMVVALALTGLLFLTMSVLFRSPGVLIGLTPTSILGTRPFPATLLLAALVRGSPRSLCLVSMMPAAHSMSSVSPAVMPMMLC